MSTCQEIKVISHVTDFSFSETWYQLTDESHFWMKWRLAALKNQFCYLNIPLDKKMIGAEVGCGRGVLRDQLQKITPWTIDGIDLDINSLKLNSQNSGLMTKIS